MPAKINHHEALIYTMVLVSAADRDMPDSELESMSDMVAHLPVFHDFKTRKISKIGAECARLLEDEDGLDKAFRMIRRGLPKKLRETAYALACDVAAADGRVSEEEMNVLELIRDQLDIGRLAAAAIERGARARHLTV
jgi:tellurite resistance protein